MLGYELSINNANFVGKRITILTSIKRTMTTYRLEFTEINTDVSDTEVHSWTYHKTQGKKLWEYGS